MAFDNDRSALEAENRMLRAEIRVAREAAEIAAKLVVQQFEQTEAMLARLQQSNAITETTLRESQGIMDNAPFGICFTRDRKLFRYNNAFGDMFGFPGETGIGLPGRVIYPSDEAYAEVGRLAAPLLSRNLPFEHEMLLRRQDGRDFWVNIKAYVADPGNQAVGTVWIIQDRSTFKAAEGEIEKSNEEMAAIFESSTFGIAFIKDRVMLKANHKLEELFGYEPGELCGQPTRCWYPDEESYRIVGEAYGDLMYGDTHRRVMKLQRKDGSLFWCRLSGRGLSDDLARGSVWTVEDITVEHEATEAVLRAKEMAEAAEERLRDSYAELEAANRRLLELDKLKSDFLSSVSHELRTPLTSIRGFATLIDREFSRSFMPLAGEDVGLQKKSRRIRDNLEILLKESMRLTRLINDVLDLAKIEAGRTEWHDAPIRLEALLRDTVNAAHGMFESKRAVSLDLDIQEILPPFIGDADSIVQVVVNLLSNAAKFTERGTVTVKAFLNEDKQIQLEVRDTGVGFQPEEAEAIFDKFQQAKHGDTLADRPAGTGLGLAISREIVARHGGRIWATSEPGRGSVFFVTLPPATGSLLETVAMTSHIVALAGTASSSEGAARDSSGATAKPKVLVVDDDVGVRGYLTQLLQEQDYDVTAAADGQAAIAAAQDSRPDLITMDLAMPVMDGRTAIVKLRADPELQHIPIMVISAIPGWETAGGDLSMGKPLDELRFLENVHLLVGRETNAVSRNVRFLVLHEASEPPVMTPGSFSIRGDVSFCPLDELSVRIESGFQGMVMIPTHLLARVDLNMLQTTPSLEVMIMPIQPGQPLRSGSDFTE